MSNSLNHFTDIDNNNDTDLFLGNVQGGLYLCENITITDVENEIAELSSTFQIAAYPNFTQNVYLPNQRNHS